MKPPDDLKDWSKNDLVRECRRLRAILREHAEQPGDEPVADGGSITGVAGDPYARGGVILDVRKAVLMDLVDVTLVDSKREAERVFAVLSLAGRVNYQQRRAEQLYLFDADGAAAIVTEITGLYARAGGTLGAEYVRLVDERLARLVIGRLYTWRGAVCALPASLLAHGGARHPLADHRHLLRQCEHGVSDRGDCLRLGVAASLARDGLKLRQELPRRRQVVARVRVARHPALLSLDRADHTPGEVGAA